MHSNSVFTLTGPEEREDDTRIVQKVDQRTYTYFGCMVDTAPEENTADGAAYNH